VDGRWFDIFIHQQNYPHVSIEEIPFRRAAYPAFELTFSDRDIGSETDFGNGVQRSYPASSEYHFVVEVRPVATTSNLGRISKLTSSASNNPTIGLEVGTSERYIRVWVNPSFSTSYRADNSDTPQNNLPVGTRHLNIARSALEQASFIAEDESGYSNEPLLDPGEHSVLVVSDLASDASGGWTSFQDLASAGLRVEGSSDFGTLVVGESVERPFMSAI